MRAHYTLPGAQPNPPSLMNKLLPAVAALSLALPTCILGADMPIADSSAVAPQVTDGTTTDTAMPTNQGVWRPIAAVMGGMRLPGESLKAITLRVTGENYEVTIEGEKEPDKGTCILDTTTAPKRMTIKSTEGPNRGKTFLAIYEMKNAVSMRVCYDLSGKDFPKEFKAPKGTSLYLVGYRRQK